MSRAVFLDRDGTLVRDTGYVHRIEDYALLPGVADGLRRLADAGYRLIVVTNQSGIGRGYFDRTDFERFQAHLCADLARQRVHIDATYHCPHAPGDGCACRKPAPGLIERAAAEHDLDLGASWVIGDSARDVTLAHALGLAGAVLVLTGQGPAQDADVDAAIERAVDLGDAAEHILGRAASG